LLVERFFDWSHLRYWGWYSLYQDKIAQKTPPHPYIILACTVLPLLIVIGLLQFLFKDMVYGVIELLFQIIIVLYCLGPKNLWADAFASMNALASNDKQAAVEKLKIHFGLVDVDASSSLHASFVSRIFIEANNRVFAPLFWFVVLGPIGIVLYRLISLSAISEKANVSHEAHLIKTILDWIPARLMSLLFVFGKQYVSVFGVFCQKALTGLENNEIVLAECGTVAIVNEEKATDETFAEKIALTLLDRTFVIWLILVAIIWII